MKHFTATRFGLLVLIFSLLPGRGIYAGVLTFSPEGTAGMGNFQRVHIRGDYAYCAMGRAGLGIVDISAPASPKIAGRLDTPGYAADVFVQDHYAFVADNKEGMQVIDVSIPKTPKRVANYNYSTSNSGITRAIHIKKDYAYLACFGELIIMDVSTPTAPVRAASVDMSNFPSCRDVFVSGDYAYLISVVNYGDEALGNLFVFNVADPRAPRQIGKYEVWGVITQIEVKQNNAYLSGIEDFVGFQIIDVSNPSRPRLKSELFTRDVSTGIFLHNNYACLGLGSGGMQILDVSDPSAPKNTGFLDTPGTAMSGAGIENSNNNNHYAFLADGEEGLRSLDLSVPSAPVLKKNVRFTGGEGAHSVFLYGNYAYVCNIQDYSALQIFDVYNPAAPVEVAAMKTPERPEVVFVQGNYAYLANNCDGFKIIDVGNPKSPKVVGTLVPEGSTVNVIVSGTIAYLACAGGGVKIVDVSNPSAPAVLGGVPVKYAHAMELGDSGKYLYASDFFGDLKVIDVSNPVKPVVAGSVKGLTGLVAIEIAGDYLYACYGSGIYVFDITSPTLPRLSGTYRVDGITDMAVSGTYVFLSALDGITVLDIANPAVPNRIGHYYTSGSPTGIVARDNLVYIAHQDFSILSYSLTQYRPHIGVNRSPLRFAARCGESVTCSQPVRIYNTGEGTLNWRLSTGDSWLSFSPGIGFGGQEVFVSANPSGLAPGTYSGTVEISSQMAVNSPVYIPVTLTVQEAAVNSPPFGEFSRPSGNSTVSGSIALTGWALDDIGVQNVRLFREEGNRLVYIDDALFVEGARPDVENAFPGYPGNHRAGWGYMLLTNYLPGGNGVFTIHAIAEDTDGNQTTLGVKTVTVDNANAVKPFGAIDTPKQGETVSGDLFVNFGWVLTPQPNVIPLDGSTIRVWIDGKPVGNPVYNRYRADISGYFPGFANSEGAVGYYHLDITGLTDGIHTIQWTAEDDAGNTDGIGSRFFHVWNPGNGTGSQNLRDSATARIEGAGENLEANYPLNKTISHIDIREGYNLNATPRLVEAAKPGHFKVITSQSGGKGRLEIVFPGTEDCGLRGFLRVGEKHEYSKYYPLPAGSSLDEERGIFYWQPGPGFHGKYELVFTWKNNHSIKNNRCRVYVSIETGIAREPGNPGSRPPENRVSARSILTF